MVEITKYKCTECRAEDMDRGNNPPAPYALVCWNCKAGSKMPVNEQLTRGYGMIPLAQYESVHG